MYPEEICAPMRKEMTGMGFSELRTAEEVDAALGKMQGSTLLVFNSVCGCAGGNARPALKIALEHETKPARLTTAFAGQDLEATARARSYIAKYPPSSPSMALFVDGKIVAMLERHQIEGRMPADIAADLTRLFDQHCK
ncbi:MAG: BrxA/BrxB family bacilliredoxin [bacterium]